MIKPITSIAIAWNASRESALAVALAMPLLERAKNVFVLAGTSADLTDEDISIFVESLKWHGINATPKLFKASGGKLAQHLQDEAQNCGAQLLVLGAYSHSRLREFVLGGVTDDMLEDGRMPVLMAH